jgi:hypothetical protein
MGNEKISRTYPLFHLAGIAKRMRGGAQSFLAYHAYPGAPNKKLYFVVKCIGNPQGNFVLFNELVASRLAQEVDLPCAVPATVYLSEYLANDIYFEHPTGRLPVVPGTQFGSTFVNTVLDPGYLFVYDWLPGKHAHQIRNIKAFAGALAFDKWVCNTDNRQMVFYRPQLDGRRGFWLKMIDNGYAFGGPEMRFRDVPLMGLAQYPYSYDSITGWDCFEPWLSNIEKIEEAAIRPLFEDTPAQWYPYGGYRSEELMETLLKRRSFIRELIAKTVKAAPAAFKNFRWS